MPAGNSIKVTVVSQKQVIAHNSLICRLIITYVTSWYFGCNSSLHMSWVGTYIDLNCILTGWQSHIAKMWYIEKKLLPCLLKCLTKVLFGIHFYLRWSDNGTWCSCAHHSFSMNELIYEGLHSHQLSRRKALLWNQFPECIFYSFSLCLFDFFEKLLVPTCNTVNLNVLSLLLSLYLLKSPGCPPE